MYSKTYINICIYSIISRWRSPVIHIRVMFTAGGKRFPVLLTSLRRPSDEINKSRIPLIRSHAHTISITWNSGGASVTERHVTARASR